MGHKIEVYETHDKLGGMLRYGIPNYRFPKDRLDEDIRAILNSGDIHVTYNTTIGKDIPVKDIYEKHDAIFVGIGAQTGKTLRIEGADAGNVVSAVDILDQIGNGNLPDYTGKSVVVIGGGTAGLEAACTAAEVGCTTFLIEKNAELGGLASVISKIPDKKRLADFPNYMIHRASKLHNLFIFKNTAATVEMVKSLNPDIIVNATGSVPTLPPITGLHDLVDKDDTRVATVLKMIERINEYPEDMKGKKVAIIGGGAVGLDVMEFFTPRGAEVTMVEMLPMIGNGLDPVTKCDTNAKMAKYNVRQMTNTALQEVKSDRYIVKNPDGEIEEIPFDYGFICLGMRANTPVLADLEEAFSDTNVEIVNIGDSKRARRIIEGTEEGRNILNVLARHDFL